MKIDYVKPFPLAKASTGLAVRPYGVDESGRIVRIYSGEVCSLALARALKRRAAFHLATGDYFK